MLQIGFVGLGKMGKIHLMNCRHIKMVQVNAVADSSKQALQKAKVLGAKRLYVDYTEMLKKEADLDAIIVSVPNYLHAKVVMSALETGVNVFVEKPMAITTQECREIVRLTQRSRKIVMAGHVLRFRDSTEKMKEVVNKGYIGNLEVITLERIGSGPFSHGVIPRPVPEWWLDPVRAGGGALMDNGYHLIDLFRFFAGDCSLLYSNVDYKFNLPVEDTAVVMLKSNSSRTKGIVHAGWYEKTVFPQSDTRVILHGDSGYISSDHFRPRNVYWYAAKEGLKNLFRKVAGKEIRPFSYAYGYHSFFKELRHFFDCVENNEEPRVSVLDGLKAVQIIEEAYRQAPVKNGRNR